MTSPLRVLLVGKFAAAGESVLAAAYGQPLTISSFPEIEAGVEAVAEAVADADAFVGTHFTAEMAHNGVALRLVQAPGTGTNLIDLSVLPETVAVCNVFEHDTAMAEYAVMAMIALKRRLVPMDRDLRRGKWDLGTAFGAPPGGEVRSGHVCILGGGTTARALVPIATALGMRSTVVRRRPDAPDSHHIGADRVVGPDLLREALEDADFLVIAVPLTDETRRLISEDMLTAMPSRGIVINPARSEIIDERALYDALTNGRLAGAALDVWTRDPVDPDIPLLPSPYPFHDLDNVIVTPHIAGWSTGTQARRWQFIAHNLHRLARSEPVENVVSYGLLTTN